ncbi:MAG: ClpXP protease specificity-enhancing factor [Gammaproteobacteria bacterium]|nr:ClpXP protease specificity-enhancing factor [Gammaproteobacteria bacterium]
MTSNRPYLIRALYEWLVDNDLTPYLLVDADRDGVHVPSRYVEEGRIVLNVSPSAVRDLNLGNELIAFEARFGGSAFPISLPPDAVLGVYARENGKGMLFPDDGVEEPEQTRPDHDPDPDQPRPPSGGKPSLKVVK